MSFKSADLRICNPLGKIEGMKPMTISQSATYGNSCGSSPYLFTSYWQIALLKNIHILIKKQYRILLIAISCVLMTPQNFRLIIPNSICSHIIKLYALNTSEYYGAQSSLQCTPYCSKINISCYCDEAKRKVHCFVYYTQLNAEKNV